METITIYHNPLCSKSRATLALLEENDVQPEIVYYLETPPTVEEIKDLLQKLDMTLPQLLRSNEAEYEELGLGDDTLSEAIVFDLVSKHPQLLERPIVVKGNRAVLGRPPENVLSLIEE